MVEVFIDLIKFVQKYEIPPLIEKAPEVRTIFDKIKLIKYIPLMNVLLKWSKITSITFAKRFKSKFLKEAFELIYEGEEYSVLFIAIQLTYFSSGSAGYPVNGSLTLSKCLEERYYKLGGNIKVLSAEEKHSAMGIILTRKLYKKAVSNFFNLICPILASY